MPKGDEGSSDQTKTVFYQHLAPPVPMTVTVGVNILLYHHRKPQDVRKSNWGYYNGNHISHPIQLCSYILQNRYNNNASSLMAYYT